MLSLLIVGLLFGVPPDAPVEPVAPGDGLVLSSTPIVRAPVRLPRPRRPVGSRGFGAGLGVTAIVGGAVLTQVRRRRDDEPFFVVVHGNGGSSDDFGPLLERLGVPSNRVVAFDYLTVGGGSSSTEASRTASTERAAQALDELIRGLSIDHSNIYSIHHSRGGAIGVSMIGSLDDGTRPPIDGYVGAALLDPAIGSGWLGRLQRLGGLSSLLPDNGGFTTERCTDGICRDVREHLGDTSGVEVIAIRNLDAEVTNFRDRPEGLRVYDLVHDGGVPARFLLPVSPLLALTRIWRAHASVLDHHAVAACIEAEVADGGSCVWKHG